MAAPDDWGTDRDPIKDKLSDIGTDIFLCITDVLFLPIACASSIEETIYYKKLDKFIDKLESNGFIVTSDNELSDITELVKAGKKYKKKNKDNIVYNVYIKDPTYSQRPILQFELSTQNFSDSIKILLIGYPANEDDRHVIYYDIGGTYWLKKYINEFIDWLRNNNCANTSDKIEECLADI